MFLCLLIFTGRCVPLLISVVTKTTYALGPYRRKSKAIEDLFLMNIEQNVTGCLNSTSRHKNRGTIKQFRIRIGRFLEKI